MFLLKQFLKALLLPPVPWLVLLLAVLIFWRRTWARALLFVTFLLIVALHSGPLLVRGALPLTEGDRGRRLRCRDVSNARAEGRLALCAGVSIGPFYGL